MGRTCIRMNTSTSRFQIIQNAVTIIGLSFAMVLNLNIRCTLNINWIVILLCANLIYLLYFLMDYNKRNIFTYVTLFIVALCILIFIIVNNVNLYESSKRVLSWFGTYQKTKDNYQISYALIIILISIVFFMILFYFINKYTILQYISSLGLLVWLVYCAINGTEVNKISLGIIFIYILQSIVKLINTVYNKEKFAGGVLPLCIIIGVLAVSIPSRPQPIQWKIVKQIIHTISDEWQDITFQFAIFKGKYTEEFSLNFTGFSDEDSISLGGKVYPSDKVILIVSPNTKPNGSTYLIGTVRDDYNKNGWKRSDLDYLTEQEQITDLYQMLYGFYQKKIQPKENETLFHHVRLAIYYNDIKTKSLFYPLKTFNLESNGDPVSVYSSSPTLLSKKILKKDFSYEVDYFEINYESDTIQNYLRSISKVNTNKGIVQRNYNRNDCISYLKSIINLYSFDETILNEDFTNVLEKRSSTINKYYTKVPKQIPNRVMQLAKQITAKYDNNYDKLKAIETYLSTYKYTLSPEETKAGEDFVDYFLFEQKEGYCTYFATAMAILARSIDIPTRYVEGVLVDYQDKEASDYLVSSKSSHAWVEAYIEGFGWIPFEPTPTKYADRYVKWKEKENITSQTPELSAPEYPTSNLNNVNKVILPTQKTQRIKYMVLLCIIIISIIGLILVAVLISTFYSKKHHYKNASNEEKVKYLLHDILIYLAMDGQEINAGETLADYVNRLGVTYNFEENTLKEISYIYMKQRYANKQIKNFELEKVMLYHKQLKNYVVKNTGTIQRIKYYCRKAKFSC